MATGINFRKQYFMRRAIATTAEFAEGSRLLEQCADFDTIRGRFPTANNGGKSKAQLTSQLCAALSFDSAGVRSLFSSRNSCATWMQRRMILRNADVPVGLSGCRWFFCLYSSNGI
jgi:hypothetical protein